MRRQISDLVDGDYIGLRDLPPGTRVRQTILGDKNVRFTSIAFSPDGKMIAVGAKRRGGHCSVNVHALDGTELVTLDAGAGSFGVIPIAWDSEGKKLAAATDHTGLRLWDFSRLTTHGHRPGQATWQIEEADITRWFEVHGDDRPSRGKTSSHEANKGERQSIYAIAWSPDNERVAFGGDSSDIFCCEPRNGKLIAVNSRHGKAVTSLIWPTWDRLVSASFDGTIQVGPFEENNPALLSSRQTRADSIAILPDGVHVLSGCEDGTIRKWDLGTGRQDGIAEGMASEIRTLSVGSSKSWIAAQGDRGRVWLLDVDTLARLADFSAAEPEPLYGVSASPAEPILAVLADDRRAIVILEVDESELRRKARGASPTRYSNAKVVLVGDTGVGKSGLALRLRGKRWHKTDSTHGRKVHLLESFEDKSDPHGPIRRDVLLWDLAGQPDYRLTHQLHLDMATVALVLFDSRDPKRPLEAPEYWSHALSLARVQDPITKLLVAAREDRTGVGLPDRILEEFCGRHKFVKWLRTSAKKNLGVEEVRQFALEQIDWSKLPVITSTGWLEAVRALVEKCRRRKKSGLIQTVGELHEAFNLRRSKKCPLSEFIGCLERLDGAGVRASAPSVPIRVHPRPVPPPASPQSSPSPRTAVPASLPARIALNVKNVAHSVCRHTAPETAPPA